MYYFPCPNCENNAKFHNLHESSSEGTGCAILFFGGILSALIYEDSRRKRIQCAKVRFNLPTSLAPIESRRQNAVLALCCDSIGWNRKFFIGIYRTCRDMAEE